MTAGHRRPMRPRRGFTLAEMLVTLVIVALLAVVAMPLVRGSGERWSPRAAALDIAAELRADRAEAIRRNQAVAFTFDPATRTYGRRGHVLPPALALTLEGSREGGGRILFHPDGASSGGRIVVAGSGERIAITVDWLTGKVSAERSP